MLTTSLGLAKHFREKGIRPRDVVLTYLPPAEDWLVTLALFHEACVATSLWGVGAVEGVNATWLISAQPHPTFPASRTILLNNSLFAEVQDHRTPDARILYSRGDSSVRHVLTSGTTGAPKAVNFTVNMVENRMSHMASYWTDSRAELNLMGLMTTGGFFTALSNLTYGTPYFAPESVSERVLKDAQARDIKILAGSPTQLGHALSILREHDITLPSLEEVRLAGSQPTEALVEAISEHLGVPVKSVYGSTEGGGITMKYLAPGADRNNLGTPVPGVNIEIIGDAQKVLGPNEDGAIRYRSPGLSPGYIGAHSSASAFQNGWFSPGDYGHLTSAGELVLVGREDDLINVGGTKCSPSLIEDAARDFSDVQDAATFIIERVPGVEELGIALVATDSADLSGLDRELRRKFPATFPTVFGVVDSFPMNHMGKVLRHQLAQDFLKRLNKS